MPDYYINYIFDVRGWVRIETVEFTESRLTTEKVSALFQLDQVLGSTPERQIKFIGDIPDIYLAVGKEHQNNFQSPMRSRRLENIFQILHIPVGYIIAAGFHKTSQN